MPPRFGKLDLATWGKSAPTINGYKTEPWILKGAKILTINMEIDDDPADNLLPATMHPSIPEYAIFLRDTYPESPVGAFSIAEVRVSGRTGVRPRGFVLRSYCDNDDARRELAARWGYPTVAGDVKLDIRHDRVVARVSAGGKTGARMRAARSRHDLRRRHPVHREHASRAQQGRRQAGAGAGRSRVHVCESGARQAADCA